MKKEDIEKYVFEKVTDDEKGTITIKIVMPCFITEKDEDKSYNHYGVQGKKSLMTFVFYIAAGFLKAISYNHLALRLMGVAQEALKLVDIMEKHRWS